MSEITETSLPECANCFAPLEGAYCHACGQRAKNPRRLVIALVQDVIVETLSVDSKLSRTIWLLFRAPGRLAKAYVSGQRVRYTPPFRLYLFTSVLFFAALFWQLSSALDLNATPDTEQPTPTAVEQQADTDGETANPAEPPSEVGREDTDIDINLGLGEGTAWGERIDQRLEAGWDRLQDDPRLFIAQTRDNIPRVLLLAPLAYAFMLVILYVYRRKFLLYDHLITSLYMHAGLYGFLLAIMLFLQIPFIGGWLAVLVAIWGLIQPYAVLRQVYGSNWFSVVAKGTSMHFGYLVMLIVLVTAGLGFALYNS